MAKTRSATTDVPTITDLPHGHESGCGALMNRLGLDLDGDVAHFCADGSACNAHPTRVVEVGGVEVAACGTHVEAAKRFAADYAEVELDESRIGRDLPSGDDYDPEADEHDDESEAHGRCDRCEFPVVPRDGAGYFCPSCADDDGEGVDARRSSDGSVLLSDGGSEAPVNERARCHGPEDHRAEVLRNHVLRRHHPDPEGELSPTHVPADCDVFSEGSPGTSRVAPTGDVDHAGEPIPPAIRTAACDVGADDVITCSHPPDGKSYAFVFRVSTRNDEGIDTSIASTDLPVGVGVDHTCVDVSEHTGRVRVHVWTDVVENPAELA